MNNANIPVAQYKALAPSSSIPPASTPHDMVALAKVRRHEVHRHHLQAPRRLRHVRLQGQPLQHRRRHAVQARSARASWPRRATSRASSWASTTRRTRTGPLPAAPPTRPATTSRHLSLGQGAGRQTSHKYLRRPRPSRRSGRCSATTATFPPSSGSTRPLRT